MKSSSLRWSTGALITALFCASISGCVVEGGGMVDESMGFDTGVDYYQPAGVVVGGWEPGYRVGPVGPGPGYSPGRGREGDVHPVSGPRPAPGGSTHAYKPAPASHSAPSIPTARRK